MVQMTVSSSAMTASVTPCMAPCIHACCSTRAYCAAMASTSSGGSVMATSARADLADGDGLPKLRIASPASDEQILMQAGEVTEATAGEERRFEKEYEVDEGIDHGCDSSSVVRACDLRGAKAKAPSVASPMMMTIAETLKAITSTALSIVSAP